MSQAAYPIEVEFPDIGVHAEGNTGITHVHSFDSGAPGPRVMSSAASTGRRAPSRSRGTAPPVSC
ncbi:hypothetical protein ACS0X5_12905 [Burkholderia gladioli]|uniref:hypothetical protein n=1 Tax=Burkholderia gladioli TaxID=28095 RepID=UPI001FC7D7A6|nr:hypothetical protein [Burkholderia gladioli]